MHSLTQPFLADLRFGTEQAATLRALAGPLRRHDVEVERELKRDYEVGPLRRQGSELSVAISPSGDYDPSTLAYSGLLDKRFALRPLCTRR